MTTPVPDPAPLDLPTDARTIEKMTAAQWKTVLDAPAPDALRWMTRAARQGHPGSQALLGQWLLDGCGAPDALPNPDGAFTWFLKAAQQGDAMAMNMAGRCCENGWGVAPDPKAAVRWYRHAADKGLDAGIYNLANQFASGQGVPRDDAQAFALYRKAAKAGHAKSMTRSGRYFEDGLGGVARDTAQAMDCYRRGAEGGDFRGQYAYARMLAERGEIEASLHWLRRVPLTATPGFLDEVGHLLAKSTDVRFAVLGRQMRDQAAQRRVVPPAAPTGAQAPLTRNATTAGGAPRRTATAPRIR